jgi:hypothetical protein
LKGTSDKCWDLLDSDSENIGNWAEIPDIYKRFISNEPITVREKELVLLFLQDLKSNIIAQRFFSKIILWQSDKNKDLLNTYLRDIEWNYYIANFVKLLKTSFENYSLTTSNNIKTITKLWTQNWLNYYIWEKEKGNCVFVIFNWTIIYLQKNLINTKLINDWLIFWLESNTAEENKQNIWVLYEFTWKWFTDILRRPWLNWLEASSEFKDYYISNGNWKKWLYKIKPSEVELKWWEKNEVTEHLSMKNDDIIIHLNWFVTTINKVKEWWKIDYTTYAKEKQGLDRHLLPQYMKEINKLSSKEKNFFLENLWDDYFMIFINYQANIYKFSSTTNSLEEIDWLKWISFGLSVDKYFAHIDTEKLFNWEPTQIEYKDGSVWISIFDKNIWKLKTLISIPKDFKNFYFEEEQINISTSKGWSIIYFKDWKLYWIKKWYKYISNDNYIKKEWLKWLLEEKVYMENFYENMQEYFEELDTSSPVIID